MEGNGQKVAHKGEEHDEADERKGPSRDDDNQEQTGEKGGANEAMMDTGNERDLEPTGRKVHGPG